MKLSHTKDCKGEQQYWCQETSNVPRCRSEEAESEIRTLRNLLVRMLESQGHKPSCTFTACNCGTVQVARDVGLSASSHLRGDRATITKEKK